MACCFSVLPTASNADVDTLFRRRPRRPRPRLEPGFPDLPSRRPAQRIHRRARGDDRANSYRWCRGRGGGNARLARDGVRSAPSDSLATRRESPSGLSVAGARGSLPAMSGIVSILCPVSDSFLFAAGRQGTRIGSLKRYIPGVVICVRSCDMASRPRDFLTRYPKAAYMSSVESWRELPDGDIEFTMRRLPSAD